MELVQSDWSLMIVMTLLITIFATLSHADEGILPDVFGQQCFGTLQGRKVVARFPSRFLSDQYQLILNEHSTYQCQSRICQDRASKNFLILKLKPNGNLLVQRFETNTSGVTLEKKSNMKNMRSGTTLELAPLP